MLISEAITWLENNEDEQLFVRVHGVFAGKQNIPAFCANNARSTLNGAGPETLCPVCDGDGCTECADSGLADNELTSQRGYSCYAHPKQLCENYGATSTTQDVVIFSGERVGTGADGEPLAIPDGRIEIWTSLVQLSDYTW